MDPSARRAAFARGFRELLAPGVGLFAWGLVTGLAIAESGLTVVQSLGMTLLAYAGSAQLASLPLIVTGAPVWIVVLTATIVNLRFVIYSLALRESLGGAPRRLRLFLGYLTGDVTFVKYMTLLEREPGYEHRIAYFFGSAVCNWLIWQTSSILGILAAGAIPRDSGFGLAGNLALLSLFVPLCTRAPPLAGVLAASVVATLAHGLPLRLGVPAAVACGITAAVLVEARQRQARAAA